MGKQGYPKPVLDALERDAGITISQRKRAAEDTRFVYGATCTWYGSIHEVDVIDEDSGVPGIGLPCCPKCGGMLFEMENESVWWQGVDTFEDGTYSLPNPKPHPGYRALWEWGKAQPKCFRDVEAMNAAYNAAYKEATGKVVDIER